MAYTTIDDPSAYFKVQLYTGTGSTLAVTFNDTDTDMQPDLIWIKVRNQDSSAMIQDSVRGTDGTSYRAIKPSATSTQSTNAGFLTTIGSDGFTVGTNGKFNASSDTYVAWCWKANGSGSANSEGNTTTTATSANTTSGFSIITYEGDGATATLGHGLGAVPHFIIQKNLDDTENWQVYHHKNTSAPETDYLTLNTNNATGDQASRWNDTAPTSTLITIGSDSSVSQSGESMVMYAWSEVQGYSKFGSYEGNNSSDGCYVHLGFRPSMVIIKNIDAADSWGIFDTKREPYNTMGEKYLIANETTAEYDPANVNLDFLANGFKLRHTDQKINSSHTFVYMAWADAPFVNSKGVPATAF